jgi:hypothetical protein
MVLHALAASRCDGKDAVQAFGAGTACLVVLHVCWYCMHWQLQGVMVRVQCKLLVLVLRVWWYCMCAGTACTGSLKV